MADATQKPKATLHWLDRSRSQRILWLLQECKDLDVDIKVYKRGADRLAPASLKEIHPLGKSPTVTIEAPALNGKPLVLAESGFIIEYLCDYFAPHLVPKRYRDGEDGKVGGETEEWLRYRFYMHYTEGSLMTLLMITLFVDMIGDNPDTPFFIKPITRGISRKVYDFFLTKNLATHFSFLESQLASSPGEGKYLCGKDLTAADIFISFPLIAAKDKIDGKTYPKLVAYSEMLEKSEGYVSSVKKIEEVSGEPFKAM